MAFRIQKQRSGSSRQEPEHEGGFKIPSSQIRSKPQRDLDVSDTLGNIDDVLANQPDTQSNRMDQLQQEADAANAAGANDLTPDDASGIAQDSQAAAAAHRAKASSDRAAMGKDMSDSAKDAKGNLKSAQKNTGLDLNRPLSDSDKQKYSTKEERAGLGGAAAAGVSGRLAPIADRIRNHMSGNKKAYGAGGGALGLVALLITAFIALLPLKLEGMMQNIVSDHFEGAVSHAVERRAEMMFFKYLVDASQASGRPVVATGSPLADLYKTWRVGKFEDQLASKYGIKITKVGNKIRVSSPQGTGDFENVPELEKYFGDLNHRQFRSFLRDATKMVTRRHQVLLRRHVRLWMRNAYGFRLGKIFTNEKDVDKAKIEVDEKLTKTIGSEYKTRLGKSIACLLGSTSECPDKTPNTNNSEASSEGKAAGDAADQVVADDIAKTTGKDFIKDITADLLKVFLKRVAPIIGWVDMAAHLDDFIWNNRADAVIAYIRGAALANDYGAYQVASDQMKAGEKVSGAEVNATMNTISNIEKSCEYQRINQGGAKQGCDKVGNEKKVGVGAGQLLKDIYTSTNPYALETHYVYVAYLKTIGKIVNWLGNISAWLIGQLPFVSSIEDWLTHQFINLLSFLINPGCTGHEKGSEAYNCVSGGADVVANAAADNVLGAPEVTDNKAGLIDSQIASENDRDEASKGLWHRVASLDYQHSLLNLLIARIPTNPVASAFHSANAFFASTNWFNFSNMAMAPFRPQPAYADVFTDAFGVKQHRYTDEELDTTIDEDALKKAFDKAKADGRTEIADIRPEDCPDSDKRPNLCMLDIAAIQAQIAVFTTKNDGGLPAESSGTTTAPGGNLPPTGKCQVNPPGQVAGAVAPPENYTRDQSRGVTLNKRTLAMLTVAEGYFGQTIPLSQGSYNPGGVTASFGTHDGGGAMDVSVRNFSEAQVLQIVLALRKAGFAAWERVPSEGFVHHIHAIAIGDAEASDIAQQQMQDYFDGGTGLASGGTDRNASLGRPWPAWAAGYCK
jgi:hypothetical protein